MKSKQTKRPLDQYTVWLTQVIQYMPQPLVFLYSIQTLYFMSSILFDHPYLIYFFKHFLWLVTASDKEHTFIQLLYHFNKNSNDPQIGLFCLQTTLLGVFRVLGQKSE